jgi:hypothetical protein
MVMRKEKEECNSNDLQQKLKYTAISYSWLDFSRLFRSITLKERVL